MLGVATLDTSGAERARRSLEVKPLGTLGFVRRGMVPVFPLSWPQDHQDCAANARCTQGLTRFWEAVLKTRRRPIPRGFASFNPSARSEQDSWRKDVGWEIGGLEEGRFAKPSPMVTLIRAIPRYPCLSHSLEEVTWSWPFVRSS